MNERGGDDSGVKFGREKRGETFSLFPSCTSRVLFFFFSWSLRGGAESSQLTNGNRPSERQDVTKTTRGAEAHKSTCCLTNEKIFNLK